MSARGRPTKPPVLAIPELSRELTRAEFDTLATAERCAPCDSGEFDVRIGPTLVLVRAVTGPSDLGWRTLVHRRKAAEAQRPARERGDWRFANVAVYAYRGRDLFSVAAQIEDLAAGRRATILAPLLASMAASLAEMHAQGMAHGDVKGENWLLDPESEAIVAAPGGGATVTASPVVSPCDLTAATLVDQRGRSEDRFPTHTWISARAQDDRRDLDVRCLGLTALHLFLHLHSEDLKRLGRRYRAPRGAPTEAAVRLLLPDGIDLGDEGAKLLALAGRIVDGHLTACGAARELRNLTAPRPCGPVYNNAKFH